LQDVNAEDAEDSVVYPNVGLVPWEGPTGVHFENDLDQVSLELPPELSPVGL